jgi:hypothetical protein
VAVHPEHATLSSVSTSLDDLVERVTEVAERLLATGEEGDAADLFEVERSLGAAASRLRTALQRMS